MRHAKGDLSIKVLDDGTDPKYLDKIKQIHPRVEIFRSREADMKSKAIRAHLTKDCAYKIISLPVNFWQTQIGNGSGIFLLLEEDAWLTDSVDAGHTSAMMNNHGIVTVKLFWGNCEKLVSGKFSTISNELETITPRLPTENTLVVGPLITNRWKLRSLLTKLAILKEDFLLPYYTLYTVSSAFFSKQYWQYLFQDGSAKLNEGDQLFRALMYKQRHAESGFAKTTTERVKTTYKTSSLNTFKSSFDMLRLNFRLSELWYKDQLLVDENLPSDFSTEYIRTSLGWSADHPDYLQWLKWITDFKSGYQRLGIETGDNS